MFCFDIYYLLCPAKSCRIPYFFCPARKEYNGGTNGGAFCCSILFSSSTVVYVCVWCLDFAAYIRTFRTKKGVGCRFFFLHAYVDLTSVYLAKRRTAKKSWRVYIINIPVCNGGYFFCNLLCWPNHTVKGYTCIPFTQTVKVLE